MEYPKMLYRSSKHFSDMEALKEALMNDTINTKIVHSEDAEISAMEDGWIENHAEFICENEPNDSQEVKDIASVKRGPGRPSLKRVG